MPFNFNQKNVFLTYPQCSKTPEELLEFLQSKHQVASYTISQEKHGDGGLHLHAVIAFSQKLHTRSERYFDMGPHHPNIKPLKTKRDVQDSRTYVIKDGKFITNIQETLGKRAALAEVIIKEGRITKKLIVENPEIIFLNYTSIKQWLSHLSHAPIIAPSSQTNKRKHIWLNGVSNSGKTYWLRNYLSLCSEPAEIPSNNDFCHVNADTDCLYFDEYKGVLTIQSLNKLCDGYTRLNTKGGSTWISSPTVVIVSNYSIRECYSKTEDRIYETLLNRFNEFDASFKLPRMPYFIIEKLK